jgi:hypothetical protein
MTTARLMSRVLRASGQAVDGAAVGRGPASRGALSVLFGLLAANGTQDNTNRRTDLIVGPQGLVVQDSFRFVHRPLTGDGNIVAVASQDASQPGPRYIMVKTGTTPGSSYAALMVTSGTVCG